MSVITKIAGKIKGSDGIIGVAERKRITLTSAQVLALFTTPVTLVAAPAAGKYISVDEVVATLNFNSVAYTGANALEIRYTDGAGAKVTGDIAAAALNAAATRTDKAIGAAVTSAVAAAPIVAAVPTANPAAGNSTLTIDVLYRVVG